jgi:hypothetical protein
MLSLSESISLTTSVVLAMPLSPCLQEASLSLWEPAMIISFPQLILLLGTGILYAGLLSGDEINSTSGIISARFASILRTTTHPKMFSGICDNSVNAAFQRLPFFATGVLPTMYFDGAKFLLCKLTLARVAGSRRFRRHPPAVFRGIPLCAPHRACGAMRVWRLLQVGRTLGEVSGQCQ